MKRRLRVLLGISAVAGALLLSLAIYWGIWVTAAAAAGLLVGSIAGLRGRTWGIVLVLASAIAIFAVPFMGIAAWWFVPIGVAGLAPVAVSAGAMLHADRMAASVLLSLALAAGLGSAESARQGWAFEAADAVEDAVAGVFDDPPLPPKAVDHTKGIPPGWCHGYEVAIPY